jgi:hypothetical protein
MHALLAKIRAHETWVLLLIALVGLALRLWALGAKGLAYDEAATALMARAPGPEILQFHWTAAFEHPPLWQLTMRTWSALFGQSEAMLRLLPALVGAASVPLTWYWLRLLWPTRMGLRLLTAGLVATSPALVLYAQEARMYTVVVLLALLSLIALVDLVQRPGWAAALLFVVINWLLVGYHYYSLLLIGCQWLFLLLLTVRSQGMGQNDWRRARWWDGACLASVVPIALWMLFSPGFRATFGIVAGGIGSGVPPAAFFDALWRDLSFGAFRWQPEIAVWGYLLAPLVAIGAGAVVWGRELDQAPTGGRKDPHLGVRATQKQAVQAVPWGWVLVIVGLLPLLLSVALFRTLAARYVLFILPAIYALAATGVAWLWGLGATAARQGDAASAKRDAAGRGGIRSVPGAARPVLGAAGLVLGAAGLVLAFTPAVLGLGHYFGAYEKSEYREMASYLRAQVAPDEAIMLYAPRQHLLAKYYLGADHPYYTAPQVQLPPFWPVNAPPVVPEEMDGQIQELLAAHPAVWLVMTAQDEVDDGEFVPKYLTAVAYKQDCRKWTDVELCRFVSPQSIQMTAEMTAGTTAGMTAEVTPAMLYNGELRLERAEVALVKEPAPAEGAARAGENVLGRATIYAQLDWLAERKPSIDYRVTLRLLDAAGAVVVQRDEFPIGPLLPPSTWNAGDAKPGYMALPLPENLAAGEYTLRVGVYDPITGAAFADPLTVASFAWDQ